VLSTCCVLCCVPRFPALLSAKTQLCGVEVFRWLVAGNAGLDYSSVLLQVETLHPAEPTVPVFSYLAECPYSCRASTPPTSLTIAASGWGFGCPSNRARANILGGYSIHVPKFRGAHTEIRVSSPESNGGGQ
jgi:hypothetical protein